MSLITSVNQALVQPNENFETTNEVLAIRNSSTAWQNTRPNRLVPKTDNTVCWCHRKSGHKSPVLTLTFFFPNYGKQTLRRIILGSIPVGLSNQGTSPLTYIWDSVSIDRYLVSTSVEYLYLQAPPSVFFSVHLHNRLVSATGSAICSWGERHIVLHFGLHRFLAFSTGKRRPPTKPTKPTNF